MAVPKRKNSTGRKGRRRAAINLQVASLVSCPNCKKPKKTHQACPHCNHYKGKKV